MTITVDVVIVGASCSALDAAVEASRNGRRVLVVTGLRGTAVRRRIRRTRRLAGASSKRITVLTGAALECVAGVRSVEAVLLRYVDSGRRVDVNTPALLTFEETEISDRNQPEGGSNVFRSVC